MKKTWILGILVAALALWVTPAFASWSSDPGANLPVGYGSGAQIQPKILSTPDGGCWISWFDNSTGGYDVRIQRLDAAGNPLLGANGVLVADRYFSSTQDYGLSVDENGDALLAFRISDPDGSNVGIEAQKIAPDGTFPWGDAGIRFGNGTDFVASPKITAISSGDVVVGWTDNADVQFARLDAQGNELWNPEVVISDPGGAQLSLSDLHDSDSGTVIFSYVSANGFSSPKHLWAQKLDPSGSSEWATVIYDGGSLQFGNYPSFIPDDAGGAVFAWYETNNLQSHVQHLTADGSEIFPHNGVLVATTAGDIQVEPSAAYAPDTQDIFVFWTEEDALTQGSRGVSGQKIDASGNRAWGDSGVTIVSKTTNADYLTETLATSDDGTIVYYSGGTEFGQDRIYAARLDTNGNYYWNPGIVNVSTTPAQKSRLSAIILPDDMSIATWENGDTGDSDVLAQNVNADGTLGASNCTAGYTEFDGHLEAGEQFLSSPIDVNESGQKYVDLTAPASFKFVGVTQTRFGEHTYIYRKHHGHRWGAAGTYQVGVEAGDTGGDYTLCVQLNPPQ
jgi:hypothetical protein